VVPPPEHKDSPSESDSDADEPAWERLQSINKKINKWMKERGKRELWAEWFGQGYLEALDGHYTGRWIEEQVEGLEEGRRLALKLERVLHGASLPEDPQFKLMWRLGMQISGKLQGCIGCSEGLLYAVGSQAKVYADFEATFNY
jgi:hypothetical protein